MKKDARIILVTHSVLIKARGCGDITRRGGHFNPAFSNKTGIVSQWEY